MPNLTEQLQTLISRIKQEPSEELLIAAFVEFDPFLQQVNTPTNHILKDGEPNYSLIPLLRQFNQAIQENKTINEDINHELFKEANRCYRRLINLEKKRAQGLINSKDLTIRNYAFNNLYQLAFISWQEIEQPDEVIRNIFEYLGAGSGDNAQSTNMAFLAMQSNHSEALLVVRVLRVYVDLSIKLHGELIQQKNEKSWLTKATESLDEAARISLYTLLERYQLIAEVNPSYANFTYSALRNFASNIKKFRSAFRVVGNSYEYLAICDELDGVYQGLNAFPTDEKLVGIINEVVSAVVIDVEVPSKSIPGLLKLAHSCYEQIFDSIYADLLADRAIASLICRATSVQREGAINLLRDLQNSLFKAVQKSQRKYAYGLLEVLRVIATTATLPEICSQAFLGLDEKEVYGIAHFISPQKNRTDSLYGPLQLQALETFRQLMQEGDSKSQVFSQLADHILQFKLATQGEIFLLAQFLDWLDDSCYERIAKNSLRGFLENCLQQMIQAVENHDIEDLKKWSLLASRIRVNEVIQNDVDNTIRKIAYILNEKLVLFYKKRALSTGAEEKALAISLLIPLKIFKRNALEPIQAEEFRLLMKCLCQGSDLQGVLQEVFGIIFKKRAQLSNPLEVSSDLKDLCSAVLSMNPLDEKLPIYLYQCLRNIGFYSIEASQSIENVLDEKNIPISQSNWKTSCAALWNKEEKGSSLEITTWEYGKSKVLGLMTADASSAVLDEKGYVKSNINNRSAVCPFNGVYLKSDKANLSVIKNHAFYELAGKRLQGHLTNLWHEATILFFRDLSVPLSPMYPVLVSETLVGNTLEVYSHSPDRIIDQKIEQKHSPTLSKGFERNVKKSFSWQIIYALIARLGDAKDSNYILTQEGNLFAIDQEEIFRDSFLLKEEAEEKNIKKEHSIGIKNILFCMPEMNEALDSQVLDEFLALSPETVYQHWIADVATLESHYRGSGLEFMQCSQELMLKLLEPFFKLQRDLQVAKRTQASVTHWDLLGYAEPGLHMLYQRAYKDFTTPIQRFDAITMGHYNYITQVGMEDNPSQDEISARPTHMDFSGINRKKADITPVPIFAEGQIDACTILEVYIKEEANVQRTLNALRAKNMNGVDSYLKENNPKDSPMEKLRGQIQRYIFFSQAIEQIDFHLFKPEQEKKFIAAMLMILKQSPNLALNRLHIIGAQHLTDDDFTSLIQCFPSLQIVTLESCALLGQKSLVALAYTCQQLIGLTLKDLPKLTEITSWRYSGCTYPLLRDLKISHCTKLYSVYIEARELRHVALDHVPSLIKLRTSSESMSMLSLPGVCSLPEAEFASIAPHFDNLHHLDVSGCTQLTSLSHMGIVTPELKSLDLEGCASLTYLDFSTVTLKGSSSRGIDKNSIDINKGSRLSNYNNSLYYHANILGKLLQKNGKLLVAHHSSNELLLVAWDVLTKKSEKIYREPIQLLSRFSFTVGHYRSIIHQTEKGGIILGNKKDSTLLVLDEALKSFKEIKVNFGYLYNVEIFSDKFLYVFFQTSYTENKKLIVFDMENNKSKSFSLSGEIFKKINENTFVLGNGSGVQVYNIHSSDFIEHIKIDKRRQSFSADGYNVTCFAISSKFLIIGLQKRAIYLKSMSDIADVDWFFDPLENLKPRMLDAFSQDIVNDLAVLSNSIVAAGISNGEIDLWDLKSSARIMILSMPSFRYDIRLSVLAEEIIAVMFFDRCKPSTNKIMLWNPAAIVKAHAKLVLDTLMLNTSIIQVTLPYALLTDFMLQEKIEQRIQRNLLLKEKRISNSLFSLAHACCVVGDLTTLQALYKKDPASVFVPCSEDKVPLSYAQEEKCQAITQWYDTLKDVSYHQLAINSQAASPLSTQESIVSSTLSHSLSPLILFSPKNKSDGNQEISLVSSRVLNIIENEEKKEEGLIRENHFSP